LAFLLKKHLINELEAPLVQYLNCPCRITKFMR